MAFLSPLHPKLKMACALGRKDRLRGNALQGRLVEVTEACLAGTNRIGGRSDKESMWPVGPCGRRSAVTNVLLSLSLSLSLSHTLSLSLSLSRAKNCSTCEESPSPGAILFLLVRVRHPPFERV